MRGPARHRGQRVGERLARGRVVPAVEPQLGAARGLRERPPRQPLEPRGPLGARHGGLAGGLAHPERAQARERGAGVLDLVRPGQGGQRQVEEPALVLEDEPPALLVGVPVLAAGEERGADALRARLDHGERRLLLAAHHAGHAALDDPGLLAGDLGHGVAQELGVVDRDGGDRGERGARDDVGGVEPAAEAHLQERVVRRSPREGQERGAGGDLEVGDGGAGVDGLALVERVEQRVLGDELARDAHPLVEAHQMRRGVGVHAQAGGLEPRTHHGDRGALAVGARDVDHGRQGVLRVAQRVQEPPDPVEHQVDALGVQRHEPIEHGVGVARPRRSIQVARPQRDVRATRGRRTRPLPLGRGARAPRLRHSVRVARLRRIAQVARAW